MKFKCTCTCHNDDTTMHIQPCCYDGWATIKDDYIKEISICGLSVKIEFNTDIFGSTPPMVVLFNTDEEFDEWFNINFTYGKTNN